MKEHHKFDLQKKQKKLSKIPNGGDHDTDEVERIAKELEAKYV